MCKEKEVIIKKNTEKYSQCIFCLSKENLYEVKGESCTVVVTICKKCVENIFNSVVSL